MSPRPSQSDPSSVPDGERLQKVLASGGFGSRRQCEELIEQGRVEVDRKTVVRMGVRVDLQTQEIRVDGEVLKAPRLRYYVVNKPTGVVCTNHDPEGRPRVIDLVHCEQRLFPVGRLDRTSEGLILLTNDGQWANQLAHPRYGVPKTYLATVAGNPSHEQLQSLRDGVRLAEGFAKAESVKVKKRQRHGTLLELVLREGRNREIRRLLARIGHKVRRLKRIAVGPLRLESLPAGSCRPLTEQEVQQLRRASRPPQKRAPRQSRSPGVRTSQRSGGRAPTTQPQQLTSGAVLEYEPASPATASAAPAPPVPESQSDPSAPARRFKRKRNKRQQSPRTGRGKR